MKQQLGISDKLLGSVAEVMKSTAQKKAEESVTQESKFSSHYSKMGAVKPLSVEETKLAAESARAPQKRIHDTISQVYATSVAETREHAKTEKEYMDRQYSKIGAVKPISEESGCEKPASKQLKAKPSTDPYESGNLKSRKVKAQADVSDSVQLDGETIEEGEGTTPKTPREKQLAAKAEPKNKITHKDVMVARGVKKEEKDTPGNSYEHQCAVHVKHSSLGEGKTLFSQHAEPDEEGQIAWYDVMFEHGIEKRVPTADLEILVSESHMNHTPKKKKGK